MDPLERLRGTTGLWTMTLETQDVNRFGALVSGLDQAGWRALWLPEAWGREALTQAALALAASSQMVVATGIASIWARDAVTTRNGARTLAASSADRFVLGLGVSHAPLVERLRGHHYDRPLAAMAEYLAAMDAAPMHAPEESARPPRLLAALGPAMLDLAARAADGAHTYLVTPEHTAQARAALGDAFLAVEQAVVLGDVPRDEVRARARAHLEFYTGLPNYRASWARQGFSEVDWVRGGSARLQDAMVVAGDLDAIAARVAEHRDAGADHVCLQVLGAVPGEPPVAEWGALAALTAAR